MLRFYVQGSAAEPYAVVIRREGVNLIATCDCPAGSKRQYCKHRFSIFEGSTKGIVDGDISRIGEVAALLRGSDVEAALHKVAEAEDRLKLAKSDVASAKKELAKAMSE